MQINKKIGKFHAIYDTATGCFISQSTQFRSKKIGWVNHSGYIIIMVDGHSQRAHRLAWFFVHGCFPSKDIDHINGNRADNRIDNLRLASRGENMQNLKAAHKDNSSGLLGVSCMKGRYWTARICTGGKQINIGSFKSAKEAHNAYLEAKKNKHEFYVI